MAFILSGILAHALDFRLFDAQTHQPMKEFAGGMGGNVLSAPLRQWHSSAFRCVIDLVSGPIEERDFPIRPDSTAIFPDFSLDVIAIEELNHPVIDHQWMEINRPPIIPSFSVSEPARQESLRLRVAGCTRSGKMPNASR